MKKSILILSLVAILAVVIFWLGHKNSTAPRIAHDDLSESAISTFAPGTLKDTRLHARDQAVEANQIGHTKENKKAAIKDAQDESSLDKDVEIKNFAERKVLDWSAEISFIMKDALKDAKMATKTYDFLINCSKDEGTEMVYRALCAANMEKLYRKFPGQIGQKHLTFKKNLPAEINEFLKEAPLNL